MSSSFPFGFMVKVGKMSDKDFLTPTPKIYTELVKTALPFVFEIGDRNTVLENA